MEKRLKKLFDYQAFEGEPKLASVIERAANYSEEMSLSLDGLDMVAGGKGKEEEDFGRTKDNGI